MRRQADGSTSLSLVIQCSQPATLDFQVQQLGTDASPVFATVDSRSLTAGGNVVTVTGNVGFYRIVLTPSASATSWVDVHEVP